MNAPKRFLALLTRNAPHSGSAVWVETLLISDHSRTRYVTLNPKCLSTVTHHVLQEDRAIPGSKV